VVVVSDVSDDDTDDDIVIGSSQHVARHSDRGSHGGKTVCRRVISDRLVYLFV